MQLRLGQATVARIAESASLSSRGELSMDTRGWVYVISNQSMPGLLKIGFSSKDPQSRARELDNTGCPLPYVVEYDLLVNAPREVEQKIHTRLAEKREGKEWFRCSLQEAISAVDSVAIQHTAQTSYRGPSTAAVISGNAASVGLPRYLRTNRAARWRYSERTQHLEEKGGTRRYGPSHCRFDPSGAIPGFVVQDRAVAWVPLDDVELLD